MDSNVRTGSRRWSAVSAIIPARAGAPTAIRCPWRPIAGTTSPLTDVALCHVREGRALLAIHNGSMARSVPKIGIGMDSA